MDPVVDTLLWLCRIPSPTGGERALCDALEHRFAPLTDWSRRRHGDSLVLSRTRNDTRPHLVLAGHLDTVTAHHDAPPRIEVDRIYGPGASDMKAGLALMLDVLEGEWAEKLDLSLTLVFYAREEGPYEQNELRKVLDDDPVFQENLPDFAVCLEPSDNEIQLGCMGTIHATVTFEGVSAHSGRPWHGKNAIYEALPMLQRLADMHFTPTLVEGLPFTPVLTATMAHGGKRRNVIPDEFQINVNARFEPGVSLDQAKNRIERVVRDEGSIVFVDEAPSARPHRDHWAVALLEDSGAKGVTPKQAWTDVAQLDARGVPAINFGPGLHKQAHQRNEWTSVELLRQGRQILRTWLGNVAASSVPSSQ